MKFLWSILFVFILSSSARAWDYNLFQEPRGMPGLIEFIYDLFGSKKANRLLVITEPSLCVPCQILDPHIKQLKKEGYDVHEYTLAQWKKAKPKPTNLPKDIISGVPTVLYVVVDGKTNEVVYHHKGGVTAKHIKQYLTK